MRTKNRTTTILQSELPNMASHGDQSECGFSIYRGVLVQWDEDHDERVLDVLDKMPSKIIDSLLVVQEHEGGISFVWNGKIPKGYGKNDLKSIEPGDGDSWSIIDSTALPKNSDPYRGHIRRR